jgi:hypothetical protein
MMKGRTKKGRKGKGRRRRRRRRSRIRRRKHLLLFGLRSCSFRKSQFP